MSPGPSVPEQVPETTASPITPQQRVEEAKARAFGFDETGLVQGTAPLADGTLARATVTTAGAATGAPLAAIEASAGTPLGAPASASAVAELPDAELVFPRPAALVVEAAGEREIMAPDPLAVDARGGVASALTWHDDCPAPAATRERAAPPSLTNRETDDPPAGALNLILAESEGAAQVVAAAPGLPPESAERLRQLADRVAAEFGVNLTEMSLNGAPLVRVAQGAGGAR